MDPALILQAVSTVAIVGSALLFTGQVVLSWHRLRGYVADDPHLTGRGTMHTWFLGSPSGCSSASRRRRPSLHRRARLAGVTTLPIMQVM